MLHFTKIKTRKTKQLGCGLQNETAYYITQKEWDEAEEWQKKIICGVKHMMFQRANWPVLFPVFIEHSFNNTITCRILQLNRRVEWLLDQAEAIVQPFKLDRHGFYDQNLWEAYSSKSRRLKRIQKLIQRSENKARRLIEQMLDDN